MIETFNMKGGTSVPRINFHIESSTLEISGSSYPENTPAVFTPFFEWLDNYLANPSRVLNVNFKMNHFNSSTALVFLTILKKLDYYVEEQQGDVHVKWFYKYNDQDMLELGEDFARDCIINIDFVEY